MLATALIRSAYKHIAKPLFFKQDPESVHDHMCAFGEKLGYFNLTKKLIHNVFAFEHPSLEQTICGIHFKNPIGLAAGFDKNANMTQIIPSVGFGFEEIGSITAKPCAGNPKPRLWRLPKTKSLIVYYGLKNNGADEIAHRLEKLTYRFPIGVSVAKTNCADTATCESGIADYVEVIQKTKHIGDYLTINISCPNAFGGEPFTQPNSLDRLLTKIDRLDINKPIFIKLPADFSFEACDALIRVIDQHRVHGLIISNLTKDRQKVTIHPDDHIPGDKGGISGKPMLPLSNALLSHIWQTTWKKYCLIGCGGVFSAQDAYDKIKAGASLAQLITGMIFEGPQLIGEINRGLVELLKKDGYKNISEAVGSAHNTN